MRKATNTQDLYAYWHHMLAHGSSDGFTAYIPTVYPAQKGRVSHENPQSGFYRKMYYKKMVDGKTDMPRLKKDRPLEAIAIWVDQPLDGDGNLAGDEVLVCRVNNDEVDAEYVWMYVHDAISKEQYDQFMAGDGWFDGAPTELPKPDGEETLQSANVGHNNPPKDDALIIDNLITVLDKARAWMKSHKKISSDEDNDAAANLKAEIGKFKLQATKAHKKEKDPFLTGGRVVDDKYNPHIKKAETAIKTFSGLITPWMQEKERIADEKAAAAQKLLDEEAKRQREIEMAKTQDDPEPMLDVMEQPAPPVKIEPVKVKAGTRGKAVSMRTYEVLVVTDYGMVLEHFKGADTVRREVERLAKTALKAGGAVPGAALKEERRAV